MESVLILGVAGGSVVQTLVTDFSFSKKITGIELDSEIIHIANSYFGLDKISNFKCLIQDAEQFVKTDKNQYVKPTDEERALAKRISGTVSIDLADQNIPACNAIKVKY